MKRSLLDIKLRAHSAEDLSDFVRIGNAANETDGIDERSSEAGLANWLLTDRANYHPAEDLVVATVEEQWPATGSSTGSRRPRGRGSIGRAATSIRRGGGRGGLGDPGAQRGAADRDRLGASG
jgi:hypothetical protein